MNPLPNYTPAQLETFQILQRIKMAWVMLWAITIMFGVVLIAFLVAVFWMKGEWFSKIVLGVLDGTLGWCLKALIAHLFPSPTPKQ
jgi:hypothetical protein